METTIAQFIEQYETGRISRRELVGRISAFALAITGGGSAALAAEKKSTFEAVGLNHIALRVPDVARSRDFYRKHLGLKVRRESPGQNCFMTVGDNFVALFRGDAPRMDHYCYSIKNYNQKAAAEKLRANGIKQETIRMQANRIYFPDPDGLTVQLAGAAHRP